jgi:hypothetical protein
VGKRGAGHGADDVVDAVLYISGSLGRPVSSRASNAIMTKRRREQHEAEKEAVDN